MPDEIDLGKGIKAEYDASKELGDEIEIIDESTDNLIILPVTAFDKLAAFVAKNRRKP